MVAKDQGLKLTLHGELLYTETEFRHAKARSLATGLIVGMACTGVVAFVVALIVGT